MLEVNVFIPCFVDQFYPQTGMNMVRVLEKAGCHVQYNPRQTCCGQPAFNAGFFEEAGEVADKFIHDFDTVTSHYVVAPSASCVGMVRNSYEMLYRKTSQPIPEGYSRIKTRIFELSEFLTQIIKTDKISGAHFEAKAVFHDSCAGLRECGIYEEPRRLLKNVKGLTLIDLPDSEMCCGFGGTFAVKFEAISVSMAQQKVDNALAVGADTLISTDISCLMHIEAYVKKAGIPLRTVHLADVLAAELREGAII